MPTLKGTEAEGQLQGASQAGVYNSGEPLPNYWGFKAGALTGQGWAHIVKCSAQRPPTQPYHSQPQNHTQGSSPTASASGFLVSITDAIGKVPGPTCVLSSAFPKEAGAGTSHGTWDRTNRHPQDPRRSRSSAPPSSPSRTHRPL